MQTTTTRVVLLTSGSGGIGRTVFVLQTADEIEIASLFVPIATLPQGVSP